MAGPTIIPTIFNPIFVHKYLGVASRVCRNQIQSRMTSCITYLLESLLLQYLTRCEADVRPPRCYDIVTTGHLNFATTILRATSDQRCIPSSLVQKISPRSTSYNIVMPPAFDFTYFVLAILNFTLNDPVEVTDESTAGLGSTVVKCLLKNL